MRRGAKIALGVLGVVVLLLLGVAVYALTPSKPKPYEDPIPLAVRGSNTASATALASFGIQNFTVDASAERMLILYELPDFARGNETVEETYQRLVLAAGAAAAPDVELVVAVQAVDGNTTRIWIGSVADFEAFHAGEISAAELDAKIERAVRR